MFDVVSLKNRALIKIMTTSAHGSVSLFTKQNLDLRLILSEQYVKCNVCVFFSHQADLEIVLTD